MAPTTLYNRRIANIFKQVHLESFFNVLEKLSNLIFLTLDIFRQSDNETENGLDKIRMIHYKRFVYSAINTVFFNDERRFY